MALRGQTMIEFICILLRYVAFFMLVDAAIYLVGIFFERMLGGNYMLIFLAGGILAALGILNILISFLENFDF